jgi:F0F1-type ATP synthase membrane subunit a
MTTTVDQSTKSQQHQRIIMIGTGLMVAVVICICAVAFSSSSLAAPSTSTLPAEFVHLSEAVPSIVQEMVTISSHSDDQHACQP